MSDKMITVSAAAVEKLGDDFGIEVCFYEVKADDETTPPDTCPWCGGVAPYWHGCRTGKALVAMLVDLSQQEPKA